MKFSELSKAEQDALHTLNRYGSAEDCRASLGEVAAFELLAIKGLVYRKQDETGITEEGKQILKEDGDGKT